MRLSSIPRCFPKSTSKHFLSRSSTLSSCLNSSIPSSFLSSYSTSNANSKSSSASSYDKLFLTDRVELISTSSSPSTTLNFNFLHSNEAETVLNQSEAENLIVFVTEEQVKQKNYRLINEGFTNQLNSSINQGQLNDFAGLSNTNMIIYSSDSSTKNKRIIFIGIGKESELTVNSLRVSIHSAISLLKTKKLKTAVINIPTIKTIDTEQIIDIFTRISTLSNHAWSKYVTKKEVNTVEKLTFLLSGEKKPENEEKIRKIIEKAQIITESTVLARELGAERGDVVTPLYMEQIAKLIADTHSDCLKFYSMQEEELIEKGYNLIVSVGQAAKHKARIVTIEYNGNKDSNSKTMDLALVGKGITFDTGGLNLKPTNSIETMYMDMCGSGTVLSTMKALATLKPKINVVGVLALAENSIDSLAIKPHAIIKTVKGTVQISNTDAEGRLALADAFTHVQTQYSPPILIDLATLTGACVVGLGEYTAGLFSNNDELASSLSQSGSTVHERVWRLPIEPECADELKSNYSDLKSTGSGKGGGACSAAAFLQKFVEPKTKWAHLDIAGPAMYSKQRDWMPEGATGFGVQLLVDYIQKMSKK